MLPSIKVPASAAGADARFLTAFDVGHGGFDRFLRDYRMLTGSTVSVTPQELSDVLTSERLYVVVCYSASHLVGITTMTAASSLEGLVGIVQRLIVTDTLQRRGIGSMMMSAVLEVAAYRRMVRVELAEQVSMYGNSQFALRHGFRQNHLGRQTTQHLWYVDRTSDHRSPTAREVLPSQWAAPLPAETGHGSLVDRMANGYN